MRRKLLVLLFCGLACGAGYWAYRHFTAPPKEKGDLDLANNGMACCSLEADYRLPVPLNCGPEVVDGFHGDLHPLLHGQTRTEVKAYWVHPADTDYLDPRAPPEVQRLYKDTVPAVPTRTYSERDFSPLLPPENVVSAGQMWAIDRDKAAVFLKQFHPSLSTHVASAGRRPGPDGAFAVLRAVSPSHLDIVFRVHAEFDLVPEHTDLPLLHAWYSPACFLGRVVVNRDAGTVEYFQLGVPIDRKTNMHSTCWTIYGIRAHNTGRVDRMELVGGSLQGVEGVRWTNAIETAKAHDKLAAVFYKFLDIDFLPFDRMLAAAGEEKKPILAVVLLGAIDDQSC